MTGDAATLTEIQYLAKGCYNFNRKISPGDAAILKGLSPMHAATLKENILSGDAATLIGIYRQGMLQF